MKEELGIIKDIHVGMRDTDIVVCWFTVEMLNYSTLQIISIPEMIDIIKQAQVYKLEDLNNKLCVMETNQNVSKFVKIK